MESDGSIAPPPVSGSLQTPGMGIVWWSRALHSLLLGLLGPDPKIQTGEGVPGSLSVPCRRPGGRGGVLLFGHAPAWASGLGMEVAGSSRPRSAALPPGAVSPPRADSDI